MAPLVRWALLLGIQAVCCTVLLILTAVVARQVRLEYLRLFGESENKWRMQHQCSSDRNPTNENDYKHSQDSDKDRSQAPLNDAEVHSMREKSENQNSRTGSGSTSGSESSSTGSNDDMDDTDPELGLNSPTSTTATNTRGSRRFHASAAPLATMPSEEPGSSTVGPSTEIEVLTPLSRLPPHSVFVAGSLLSVESTAKRDSTSATASMDSATNTTVSGSGDMTVENSATPVGDDELPNKQDVKESTPMSTVLCNSSSSSSSSSSMSSSAITPTAAGGVSGLQIPHIDPQMAMIDGSPNDIQSSNLTHTPITNHGHQKNEQQRRRPGHSHHRKFSESMKKSGDCKGRPTLQRSRSNSTNTGQRDSSVMFSLVFAVKLLVICVCFCWSISLSLLSMFQGSGLSCKMSGRIASSLNQLAKGVAFTVFVDRVHMVFRDSIFEYKHRTLRMIYGFIAVHTLVFSVLWVLVVDYGFDPRSDGGRVEGFSGAQLCLVRYTGSPIIPAVSVICEVGIEVLTLHMFTNPLRKLIGQTEMDRDTLNMARLASKTTILTWITVLTLLIFTLVIVVTRSLSFAGPACSALFVGCLLLFPAWFDSYYERLCAVPIFISQHYLCALPDKPTKLVREKAVAAVKSLSELSYSRSNTRSQRNKKKHKKHGRMNKKQRGKIKVRAHSTDLHSTSFR